MCMGVLPLHYQAAHRPRFAGVGLTAAWPPCPGLLQEPGEEGSAGAVARGGEAAPLLLTPTGTVTPSPGSCPPYGDTHSLGLSTCLSSRTL